MLIGYSLAMNFCNSSPYKFNIATHTHVLKSALWKCFCYDVSNKMMGKCSKT